MFSKSLYVISFVGILHSVILAQPYGVILTWGIDDGSSEDLGQVTNSPDDTDLIAVDGGYYHGIALKSDGSMTAWGGNINDQTPPETTNQVADTPNSKDFISVTAGDFHNVALKSDFSLICWGENYYGQSTPPTGNDYIAITAGYAHSIALRSDGTLAAWGVGHGDPYDYDYGQVTDTPTDSNFIAVAAGKNHSLAIGADEGQTAGSIRTWGYERDNIDLGSGYYVNYNIQIPPDGNDFVAVAAGDLHSLALRSNGSLVAWGANSNYWSKTIRELYGDYGQVRNTPSDNGYIAIAAGNFHNIAMKTDGTLVAWGRDDYGQVTNTPTWRDYNGIAAGAFHSLAIMNCQLQGDFSDDCRINLNDFVILAEAWMSTYTLPDLQSMTANWLIDCHQTPSDPACVPEQ